MFWRQLAEGESRVCAAVIRRVTQFFPSFAPIRVRAQHDDLVVAPLQRGLDRVSQANPNSFPHHQPIDYRFDSVTLAFFQPNWFGAIECDNFSIDARADKSLAFHFLDDISEFADLIVHQRREDDDSAVRFVPENLIDNLLWRLPMNRFASRRIVRLTDRRKKNSQVVVNLGRGRDCRSWIGAGTALLDRDRWGKSFDAIHFRLFHLIAALPRVSGESFDVTALALGVARVEVAGRFPGTAQPRDDHQLLPRAFHVEVLQIVLARTTDLDNLRRHRDDKSRTF